MYLFIFLVLFLLGCALTDDPADLAFLDIVDAQQLFIGSGAVSKSAKGASDRLFKITDDGYVEEGYLDYCCSDFRCNNCDYFEEC